MREFRLKRSSDEEPKPLVVVDDDGFAEYDDLGEALEHPGTLMRRFSSGRVEHGDGGVVWFATYYEGGRPTPEHAVPEHAIRADSSAVAQRFYDDH